MDIDSSERGQKYKNTTNFGSYKSLVRVWLVLVKD